MSAEVELKLLLESGYSKTQLLEIYHHLNLPFSEDLSNIFRVSKESLATDIVSALTLKDAEKIFKKFPINPEKRFIGSFFTAKNGVVSLKNGQETLKLSLKKMKEKYSRSLKTLLKSILDRNGVIDTEDLKAEFGKRAEDMKDILDELVREEILEYKYQGEYVTVYQIPVERMNLVAEFLYARKPEKKVEPLLKPTPTVEDELSEELKYIAEKEKELNNYIEDLSKRWDTVLDYGEKIDLEKLESYLKDLLGEGLHFDGLLALTQQLSLSETPILGEGGKSALKTGFNLALFGDPGTGKSFSTRDLLLGSPNLGIPPHGIPGINRYTGGMTAARFIRIGQAYEGKVFNFIIPEFNDWFKYKGMVEPLKLAMEGGVIKYEMHREVIGPYKLTSHFIVNYNTRVGLKGYRVTISDPNFSAIEDRMICRLHRMTKERYMEIAKNQMRLLRGEVSSLKDADKIRDLVTAIYAIQSRRGVLGKRFKPKVIKMSGEDSEVFVKVREAILDAISGKRLAFSVRVEKNAIVLASAMSLINYFRHDKVIPIDKKALEFAVKFYVEEASIRMGETFDPLEVLRKVSI